MHHVVILCLVLAILQKYFSFLQGDLCKDALDLSSGTLNIDNSWKVGTYCQWLIPIEDDNSYITLEFHKLEVSTDII